MSYNINKIYSISNHLKSISPNMFKINNNELIIFCPFCDDSIRHSGKIDHGHCYISLDYPVFNCFRCSASGSLLKLLLSTDYDDNIGIEYLLEFIKYNFIKNKINIKHQKYSSKEINNILKDKHVSFHKKYSKEYDLFLKYIKSRIGKIDPINFLIFPTMKNNEIGCSFMNYNTQLVTTRWITNTKYRYTDEKDSIYYFQKLDFYNISDIVITEGCFDAINTYLYNRTFSPRNSIYISSCGKKYISTIEYLLMNYILIGKYNINIIFDNDCFDYKKFLLTSKKLSELYNPEIKINGWFPIIGKDVSDFSEIKII